MKTYTIKDKTIHNPDNWDDVTVSDYLKLKSVVKNQDEMDEQSQSIEILQIFSGLSSKELLAAPGQTIKLMINDLLFLVLDDIEKIEIDENYVFKTSVGSFKINIDIDNYTMGELITYEEICRNMIKDGVHSADSFNMQIFCASFMRRIVDGEMQDYDADVIEENMEICKEFKISKVYPIYSRFFFGIINYLEKNMATYLDKE